MTKWILLTGAILSEVTASLSLKGALDHPSLYILVAIGYVASFTLLALVLRQGMPLGAAYGIWGAMGVATTAVMSALIIVLIIGGVLAVELGSHTGHQNKEGVA